MPSRLLPHERLTVYQRSIELLVAVLDLNIDDTALRDQLIRATRSVVATIAEGAGEFRPREKARFYRMAIRSATECASHLEVGVLSRLVTSEEADDCRAYIQEVVAMLTAMAKNAVLRAES